MSLYERKLEKLEELAGLKECQHSRAFRIDFSSWYSDGQEYLLPPFCPDCGKQLSPHEVGNMK